MKNKIVLSYRFIILVYYLLAFLIIIMNINQKTKINVKVYPEIATNKNVEFKVTKGKIYVNRFVWYCDEYLYNEYS